ncbi:MAG: threonylcarbamoyl-AMP synthase [Thermoplasmata archaeon]|nr:threonylcarbamoyl-AMP synthase [Thermoplasmata archaeon]
MVEGMDAAVRALASGRLVVYPTDTLWGLGACGSDRRAVERLFAAKARPKGAPVSLAVSSLEEMESLAGLTPPMRAFLRNWLPGPFTVLLPPSAEARRRYPFLLGPEGWIALRLPDHPVARELARRAGPIVSSSANRHGAPAARTLAEARAALGAAVSVYLGGEPAPSGHPSTLVDLADGRPRLRER